MRRLYRMARKLIAYGLIGFQINAIVVIAGLVKKIPFPKAFIYGAAIFAVMALSGLALKVIARVMSQAKKIVPLATTIITHI